MPSFDAGGVRINYIDEGEGPAIVLVHGFASSLRGNYRQPHVIDALLGAGRRVVALDCRGHGESDKPHDSAAYNGTVMADDVTSLMDHVGIDRADIMGYSMGGFLTASLMVRRPERLRSAIIAGVGDALIRAEVNRDRQARLAGAMGAADGEAVTDPLGKGFRAFAEATGNDLQALAAMQRASRGGFDARDLAKTALPALILIGDEDTLVGDGSKLAAFIPGARHIVVPGNHLTAVGAPAFRLAIADFLAEVSPL